MKKYPINHIIREIDGYKLDIFTNDEHYGCICQFCGQVFQKDIDDFENYYVIVNESLKYSKPHRIHLPGTQGRRLQCVCDDDGLFYVTWETQRKIYLGISTNLKRWDVADIIDTNAQRPRIERMGEQIRIVYEKHTNDINQIRLATWCKSSIHYETLYESRDYLSRPSNIVTTSERMYVAWTTHQVNGERIYYRQMKAAPVLEPEYIFEDVYS